MIALVGVDGSGKTTAARWLARELTSRGTPARYFECAGGRPVIDGLAHRLGRRDGPDLLGRHGYLAIEATIRWIAITRAIVLSTLTRRVAVLDRYTFCQYALIGARADGNRLPRSLDRVGTSGLVGPGKAAHSRSEGLVRLLYAPFPRPDATFYLDLPPAQAAHRVELRGRDHEEPSYVAAFAAAYQSLPEFADFTAIDASQPADVVQRVLADAGFGVVTGIDGDEGRLWVWPAGVRPTVPRPSPRELAED
jgi:dTMP kinase